MTELQIVGLFRSRARIVCPAVSIVAVPNAGRRTRWEARQRVREGMAKGFPDVLCFWKGPGVAAIEFKAPKGRLSIDQVEWIQRLSDMGVPAIVSRDPDHALEFLRGAGAPFIDRPREQGARSIGAIIEPIISNAVAVMGLQQTLRRCPTAEGRKKLIMAAWETGAIDDAQCQLLIEAEGLETA